MFDVGRSKFYKKIKHLLKLSKTRVETIIKKRNAVQKYLKNDIAELLRNGLDVNAYGRAEGLLVELNWSTCYNFIEQCVGCILGKLAAMESQRECPNECKEAVQSLMHSAARFADMPELRELRTVFTERYGNSLEPFLNKEFAEKLRSGPPSKEKKLQLLLDIAQEYSLAFDPVSLEQKMFKPPPPAQLFCLDTKIYLTFSFCNAVTDHAFKDYLPYANTLATWMNILQEKHKRRSSNDAEDDGYNRHRRKDEALPERAGHDRGNRVSNLTEKPKRGSSYDAEDDGSNQHRRKDGALPERDGRTRGMSNLRDCDEPKRNEKDLRYCGRKVVPNDRYNIPSSSEDEEHGNNRRNSTSHDSQQTSSSSVGSFSEEEVDSRKPFSYGSIPPPYVRRNAEQNNLHDPVVIEPTTVRKSTLKPPPGREIVNNGSEENSKKAEKARQHMQSILNNYDEDQSDEEEKKLDQLLMHYSKNKQPHESSKLKENLNHHPGKESDDTSRATRHRHERENVYPSPGHGSDDTVGARRHRNARSELPHQTARTTSIRSEPAAGNAGTRGHNRAMSLQPEMVHGVGHVHPKLPDYDDLAARLAALRGK
ncbi:Regulator of Vps4 activity in the MVB pathway protein [Citrus sinensis]|nr:Regulator of Vps4 activity in the MVB pathway protein [Citrus sinensis]